MIVFDLKCSKGHTFEEWFASSGEFEKLAKKKQIACPKCGDKQVAKALMAPSVATSKPSTPSAPPMPTCGGGGCGGGMCPF
ncbi:MAG: DUF1178 family protein [Magnetospirillum sp. WYHS-4]